MASGKKKSGLSIIDVAKKAGISVSTVSRVLNNSPSVKQETRKRIFAVAKKMGYSLSEQRPGPKPGHAARKKKVAFINFLDPHYLGDDLSTSFMMLKSGIEEGAREKGMSVSFHLMGTNDKMPEIFEPESFAGFILLGWRPHASAEAYLRTRPCCWVMNNPWTPTWGDHVMPDHREAGMMALDYLAEHGCKRPVILKLGRPDRVSALREEGFTYAAFKQGIDAQSLLIKNPTQRDSSSIYPDAVYIDELIEHFKNTISSVDGIFFDCDRAMTVLYPVMVRERLIIPGKTVLIGCNNQQPFLKGISPHPATQEVHFGLIGRLGVVQLAWRMGNQDIYQRVRSMISPELIALS